MTEILEKVEVYVEVCGDYCAFHEMSINIVYDVTNEIELDEYSLQELLEWESGGHSDITIAKAIRMDDKYYVDIDSL